MPLFLSRGWSCQRAPDTSLRTPEFFAPALAAMSNRLRFAGCKVLPYAVWHAVLALLNAAW